MIRSGSSYCSQSSMIATFGLGKDSSVDEVEIRWPSGIVQKLGRQSINRLITVEEK